MTTLADALSRFRLKELCMQADGSPPPGGQLLSSQHSPMHDSHFGQGTPSHYSSSTRGPHHSLSSVKKKHPPFPTSANQGEPATKRARAMGLSSGGAAERGVVETMEGQGEWRPRSNQDPGQDSTSRRGAQSGSRSDSFGSGGASGPLLTPGLPGATGPTKTELQLQLTSKCTPCHWCKFGDLYASGQGRSSGNLKYQYGC